MREEKAMPEGQEENPDELCSACVFYPPNLPAYAYAEEDLKLLLAMACSLEHIPGSEGCLASRKTSCSLIDLQGQRCGGNQSGCGR